MPDPGPTKATDCIPEALGLAKESAKEFWARMRAPLVRTLKPCAICKEPTVLHQFATICDPCDKDLEAKWVAERNEGPLERPTFDNSDPAKVSLKPEIRAHYEANRAVWDMCRDRAYSGNLYLRGTNGVGKTRLAECMRSAAAARGLSTRKLFVPKGIKAHVGFGAQKEYDAEIRLCSKVGFLDLDDIDKAKPTVDALGTLHYLLDERRERGLETVVTANVTSTDMAEIFAGVVPGNSSWGKAIYFRLARVGVRNEDVVMT